MNSLTRMGGWLILSTAVLGLFIAGCTPEQSQNQLNFPGQVAFAMEETAVVPSPPPSPTSSPPPPPVIQIEEANQEAASVEAPTLTPIPTTAPTAIPTETAVQPTPAATFTPPALPLTLPEEHYWFRRPVGEGGVVWTDKAYPFGSTRGGQLRIHHGVEFNVPYNTEILAVAAGTVIVSGSDSEAAYGPTTNFYGNLVIIQHDSLTAEGEPVFTLYGHLNDVYLSVGDRVAMQQPIALSGATGIADGPHMHFEVRVGENSYDATRNPLLWLYPFPDNGTIAGRILWPDGSVVNEAPVRLNRLDAPSPYQATTTYAGPSVNSDPLWNENFVIDDVDAGYYEVIVPIGEDKYKAEVWVYPYRTSFVEIVIQP